MIKPGDVVIFDDDKRYEAEKARRNRKPDDPIDYHHEALKYFMMKTHLKIMNKGLFFVRTKFLVIAVMEDEAMLLEDMNNLVPVRYLKRVE